jgi:hypothetical protein
MGNDLNAYNAQLEAAIQESVRLLLENNGIVQNSDYSSEIHKMANGIYKEAYESAYSKYLDNNKVDKALMAQYAKEMGLDSKTRFKVDKYNKDGTVEYSYLENGEWVEKIVTAEEIAEVLAHRDAEMETKYAATNFAVMSSNLESENVKAMAAAQSGEYGNLSEKDM